MEDRCRVDFRVRVCLWKTMTCASLITLEGWRSPTAHDTFPHSRFKLAAEINPLEDVNYCICLFCISYNLPHSACPAMITSSGGDKEWMRRLTAGKERKEKEQTYL
jgi:hypothetical protein